MPKTEQKGRFKNVKIFHGEDYKAIGGDIDVDLANLPTSFRWTDDKQCQHWSEFPLFLIMQAWKEGVQFEDLADGFGAGLGTMGGDWSGVRDSSQEAVAEMFQRSLNHFFGGRKAAIEKALGLIMKTPYIRDFLESNSPSIAKDALAALMQQDW